MLSVLNSLLCRELPVLSLIIAKCMHCVLYSSESSRLNCSRFGVRLLSLWLFKHKSQLQWHAPLLVLEYLTHEDLRSILDNSWFLRLVLYACFLFTRWLQNLGYSWLIILLLGFLLLWLDRSFYLNFLLQYLCASFDIKLQSFFIDSLIVSIQSCWAR